MQRILLVEDERGIADAARYALEAVGFAVRWVETLAEAEAALASDGIAAVVLDVGLPDGNGFDFCRELRRHNELPVLFLTAHADEIDRVVGLEIGADDYITKPFSPRELAARVRANLRRSRDRDGARSGDRWWRAGHFVVDEDRREIRFHEQLLDLSAQQYRLLLVLLRQPGRVFSRDELMAAAWADPEMSEPRTVDSHIRDLRARLRGVQRDLPDPIRTHRGCGYSLRDDP